MVILYIIGGFILLALLILVLKLAAALLGLSLTLGFITWLLFDSFWTGAIIGGVITAILVIKDPEEFFENALEEVHEAEDTPSRPSDDGYNVSIRDQYDREVTKIKESEARSGYAHGQDYYIYRKDYDGTWHKE